MISPELLRRFAWFNQFSPAQIEKLAMIAEEVEVSDGEVIFREGQPADALYFLLEGCIDLSFAVEPGSRFSPQSQVTVGQINVGEPFGISALIEPHLLTSQASSCGFSRFLRFPTTSLYQLLKEDPAMELILLRHMAAAAIQRLHATRVQLAAAYV